MKNYQIWKKKWQKIKKRLNSTWLQPEYQKIGFSEFDLTKIENITNMSELMLISNFQNLRENTFYLSKIAHVVKLQKKKETGLCKLK